MRLKILAAIVCIFSLISLNFTYPEMSLRHLETYQEQDPLCCFFYLKVVLISAVLLSESQTSLEAFKVVILTQSPNCPAPTAREWKS